MTRTKSELQLEILRIGIRTADLEYHKLKLQLQIDKMEPKQGTYDGGGILKATAAQHDGPTCAACPECGFPTNWFDCRDIENKPGLCNNCRVKAYGPKDPEPKPEIIPGVTWMVCSPPRNITVDVEHSKIHKANSLCINHLYNCHPVEMHDLRKAMKTKGALVRWECGQQNATFIVSNYRVEAAMLDWGGIAFAIDDCTLLEPAK